MATENSNDLSYPFVIRWNFHELDVSSHVLKTPRYHSPGFPLTYYLRMNFERSYDRDPDVCVSLCCYCDYENVEIEADFTFVTVFENERYPKIIKHFKVEFDNDITELLCLKLKEYTAQDEECAIKVKGTFLIKNLQPMPLSVRVPKSNRQLFINEIGKDFVIVAEGQEFKIHKSILQQCSTVFRAMFESSNWRETKEGKMEIPTISAKLAKIAIDCFYGKKYWRFLDKSDYISLYQFADQYDFGILKYAIQNTIILTPLNVVEYANLAVEAKAEGLIQSCIENIMICSQYSVPIKDIKNLGSDVKLLIADQMLESPAYKRNMETENTSNNEEDVMHSLTERIKTPDISNVETRTGAASPERGFRRRSESDSSEEDAASSDSSRSSSDAPANESDSSEGEEADDGDDALTGNASNASGNESDATEEEEEADDDMPSQQQQLPQQPVDQIGTKNPPHSVAAPHPVQPVLTVQQQMINFIPPSYYPFYGNMDEPPLTYQQLLHYPNFYLTLSNMIHQPFYDLQNPNRALPHPSHYMTMNENSGPPPQP